jgi:hypothetical protein
MQEMYRGASQTLTYLAMTFNHYLQDIIGGITLASTMTSTNAVRN